MNVATSFSHEEARSFCEELGDLAYVLGLLNISAPDPRRAEAAQESMNVLIAGAREGERDRWAALWARMEVASGRQKPGPGVRVTMPRRYAAALQASGLDRWQVVDTHDPERLKALLRSATRGTKSRTLERSGYFAWLRTTYGMQPQQIAELWAEVTRQWRDGLTGTDPRERAAEVVKDEWRNRGAEVEDYTEERVKQGMAAVAPMDAGERPGKGSAAL